MGFRNWVTKNASKTAENVIEQTKSKMQTKANLQIANKGAAFETIGKLGLLVLLAWLTGKELSGYSSEAPQKGNSSLPGQITINNYIHEQERSEKHD